MALLAGKVRLRFQDPVYLSKVSEPEPDVAVVAMEPLDYEDQHPTPDDVFLLIEVADTTMKRDREIKALAYGRVAGYAA